MRFKSFRIRNFKGIKDTTINLESIAGASVFAFVGLNESGKTTVLEAIHSFSPDKATAELVGGAGIGVPYTERVPRHLISSFTGDVSVLATLELSSHEKSRIAAALKENLGLELNIDCIGSEIAMERVQRFRNGDFKANYFDLLTPVQIKSARQRNWRAPKNDEIVAIRDAFYLLAPNIAYFPTFVFEFPDKAFLTDRGTVIDKFYRSVFQDILDYDGKGYTIERDIIGRIRGEDMISP
jgi:hypothetical protein